MLLNVSDVQDSELFVVPLNLRYEYFNIKQRTHSSVNNTRAPTTHRATRNTASGLKTEAGFISQVIILTSDTTLVIPDLTERDRPALQNKTELEGGFSETSTQQSVFNGHPMFS